MADQFFLAAPDGTGQKIDETELTVGANTVVRPRMNISGAGATELADVKNAAPTDTLFGVITRNIENNRIASGALGALNAAVTISAEGSGAINWEIDAGTLVGTVVFEATLDDTNWFAVDAIRIDGTIIVSTTTFADRGALTSTGYSQARLRVSVFTSGTSNARLEQSYGTNVVRLGDSLPAGANSIGVLGANSGVDIGDVTVNNAAGASAVNIQDGGNSLTIDGTVTSNAGTGFPPVVTDGSAAGTTGIHVLGTDGTNAQIVRTATDGTVRVDPTGTTTQPVSGTVIANAGTGTFNVQIAAATTNLVEVQGDVAHDGVAAGNPVQIGLRANQNEPTAVADADITYGWADQQGRQVIVLNFPANIAAATHGPETDTLSTTTETTLVAGVASNSIYVTSISCSNTSATLTRIDIRDGTAGTIRVSMALAANGGGFVMQFNPPWKLTAAANLTGQLSGAVTDVRINTHFFVAP